MRDPQPLPEASGAARSDAPELQLRFDLLRRRYALAAAYVDGVDTAAPPRPVPGAHPAVVGLAFSGGHIVTVLDLAALLDESRGSGMTSLIRLADPFAGIALLLAGELTLVRPTGEEPAEDGEICRIEPEELLRPFLLQGGR